MTLSNEFSFSAATAADKEDIFRHDQWTFPTAMPLKSFMKLPTPFDYERAVLVKDAQGAIAGFHASYAFKEFNVPGASIPVSGLTWVGVHPQYRRRGILRAMIEKHFQDCIDRGESVSALFAAEPTIYGRFGYGRASYDVRFKLSRGASQRALHSALADSDEEALTVRIETFDKEIHEPLIESLHSAAGQNVNGTGLNRPGWPTRETQELRDAQHTIIDDNPKAEVLRIVIVERDGEPVGYSRFRRTMQWEDTGPDGTVNAGEVIALDPAASRKLWSVLSDLDLTGSVTAFMVPTDDPLIRRLDNDRSIKMTHVDNVWARIIDIQKALESRVYAGDVDVVLDVSDTMIPSNTGKWRLRAAAFDGASGSRRPTVEPTDDPADISLDIRELGTVYLGGPTLVSLAAAGLITAPNPRALATASVAFGWPHAPMSSWVF